MSSLMKDRAIKELFCSSNLKVLFNCPLLKICASLREFSNIFLSGNTCTPVIVFPLVQVKSIYQIGLLDFIQIQLNNFQIKSNPWPGRCKYQ